MSGAIASPEFLLTAACCRWPLSERAFAAIRGANDRKIDWTYFLRIVRRQRVVGLVHHALTASSIDLPPQIESALAARAQRIARQNVQQAAETVRLQGIFKAADIPVTVLKGVALGELVYGSIALKHSRDIDLFVPRDGAEEALRLLELDGYVLLQPALNLSGAQRRAAMKYVSELALMHPRNNMILELRWRLAKNPWLLTGVDGFSRTMNTPLSGKTGVRMLSEEDLFAYLCTHGSGHAWSRLKWLADLAALISRKNEDDIERLHSYAQARGSGRCSELALLLCHQLLELNLPGRLQQRMSRDGRLKMAMAICTDAMAGAGADVELEDRPFGSTRVAVLQMLLGDRWRFYLAQCRIFVVRESDVIAYPLPAPLHFLYLLLRLPMWLWRRARWAIATQRRRSKRT